MSYLIIALLIISFQDFTPEDFQYEAKCRHINCHELRAAGVSEAEIKARIEAHFPTVQRGQP